MNPKEAAMRARLERQSEMLIGVLSALGKEGATEEAGTVSDHLFRFLGIVTFWQSTKNPSDADIDSVNRCLDAVQIAKVATR